MTASLSPTDIAELISLSHRYASFADDRDSEQLGALFATSGILEASPGLIRTGPAEIAEAVQGLARYDTTFHLLGQITIGEDDAGAHGQTYCIAHHFTDTPEGTADRVMYIRYHDRFVIEDGWRFAHRRLDVVWAGAEDKPGR